MGSPRPELPGKSRSGARFAISSVIKTADTPEYSEANTPTDENYKTARKNVSIILKKTGVKPGRYELDQAKPIINSAKEFFRDVIHKHIAEFDSEILALYCIEQHDALLSNYQQEVLRIKLSLTHEVSFERPVKLAEAKNNFTRDARNYRYLLEHCIATPTESTEPAAASEVSKILADIDWLFTLYESSDVLHYDVDIGGIEIDNFFIPKIFYSEGRKEKEVQFGIEDAKLRLGIDIDEKDEVSSRLSETPIYEELDRAFFVDNGFTFTHLIQFFITLSQWATRSETVKVSLSYQASIVNIAQVFKTSVEDIADNEIAKIIEFATLSPSRIKILLGKISEEPDVPVWEHNKRAHRYAIRPIILLKSGLISWGAAAVDKSGHIWANTIANGYLPAQFEWPNVKEVVRKIKANIEQNLEKQAFDICSRAAQYLQHGIDFKYKFPRINFEDVGDFDVLAYWPKTNCWLTIECKYNQPPFCLKDARRLRERIFGSSDDHGQFSKIELRRKFLATNLDQLRNILKWPTPLCATQPCFIEAYVCRDIYWWMRNPRFEVPTHFVRIDGLAHWLRSQNLLAHID